MAVPVVVVVFETFFALELFKFVFVRFAPDKSVLFKIAFVRFAPDKSVSFKLAFFKSMPVKSTPHKSNPCKFNDKSAFKSKI